MPMQMRTLATITLGQHQVSVDVPTSLEVTWEELLPFYPLRRYLAQLAASPWTIDRINILATFNFGKRLGFVFLHTVAKDKDGRTIPGAAFLRGTGIGILVILECQDREYTVIVHQARMPVGIPNLREIPAETLDVESDAPLDKARAGLLEEIGLDIDPGSLINMTDLIYGDRFPGAYSSPGGTDETIVLALHRRRVTPEELESFQGRQTGVAAEGEKIETSVIPLSDLVRVPNTMAHSALLLYRTLLADGRLPPLP